MNYQDYFLEEMSALRELGKEFAQSQPRLAPFLATEAQDPDVERLLEGFAFLTARLRQKLDADFPELSQSLLRVLWPHVLKPVPSFSMLEFKPLPVLSERQRIPEGTGIASGPVQGTRCRFQTCAPVELYPLRYESFQVTRRGGNTVLTLGLNRLGQSRWSTMKLDQLRLHLHGDLKLTYSLYWMLLNKVAGVHFYLVDEEGERYELEGGAERGFTPAGFTDSEALLPNQEELFPGFRLLHEYLVYPDKFLFVDLWGMQEVSNLVEQNPELELYQRLELEIVLTEELAGHLLPKKDNIRLFCTPIVNLFAWDARPLEVDHRKTEYRLVPEGQPREHYDIFSINEVQAWGHEDRRQYRYLPYDSFAYCRVSSDQAQRLFWQKLKPSVISSYGYDTYVSFLELDPAQPWPQRETISARLTCTNRDLPVELAVGEINQPLANTPEYVEFANISPVTPCLFPVQDSKPLWQVLSYLSQNYRSLVEISALQNLMAVLDVRGHYDRQHSQASRLKRDALEKVDVVPVNRLYEGALWRGVRIHIEVLEEHFMGAGDLFLFGNVLNELLASTVPLNSFHELELSGSVKGLFHRWQPRQGRECLV